MTAWLVVFSVTVKVPLIDTPGTVVVTVPLSVPATPPPVSSSVPLPPVTETNVDAPVPSDSETLLATMSVVVMLFASVICWIEKLPLRTWPSTVSFALVAEIETYGPAGRLSETAVPPTVSDSATACCVSLIARPNVPLSVIPAGRALPRLTEPDSCPASPPPVPEVITSRPLAPVTTFVSEPPRLTLTANSRRAAAACSPGCRSTAGS